jgi:bifunctional ADP-heptose synthase (sugar kinase/adenylyltransferase)
MSLVAVATGGVFDGLHLGHVRLLQFVRDTAKGLGIPAYALVNTDESLAKMGRVHQHAFADRRELVERAAPGLTVVGLEGTDPSASLTSLAGDGLILFVKGADVVVPSHLTFEPTGLPPEAFAPGVLLTLFPLTPSRGGGKLATRSVA